MYAFCICLFCLFLNHDCYFRYSWRVHWDKWRHRTRLHKEAPGEAFQNQHSPHCCGMEFCCFVVVTLQKLRKTNILGAFAVIRPNDHGPDFNVTAKSAKKGDLWNGWRCYRLLAQASLLGDCWTDPFERIFFSRVNFSCWLFTEYFSIRSTFMLPQ